MPFQPGRRDFKMGKRKTAAKMSDDRIAWLKTNLGQFTFFRYLTNEDGEENENGPNIVLTIPLMGMRTRSFNFSALTAEELEATEKFFKLIFDEARPIVAERDRVAHEAFESGDDSHSRIYRQVPQFVIRQRPEPSDTESVHVGPESLPKGDGTDGSSDGDIRSASDSVASEEPTDSSTEDAESQAD